MSERVCEKVCHTLRWEHFPTDWLIDPPGSLVGCQAQVSKWLIIEMQSRWRVNASSIVADNISLHLRGQRDVAANDEENFSSSSLTKIVAWGHGQREKLKITTKTFLFHVFGLRLFADVCALLNFLFFWVCECFTWFCFRSRRSGEGSRMKIFRVHTNTRSADVIACERCFNRREKVIRMWSNVSM